MYDRNNFMVSHKKTNLTSSLLPLSNALYLIGVDKLINEQTLRIDVPVLCNCLSTKKPQKNDYANYI